MMVAAVICTMISVMILPYVKILVHVSQKTWDTNVIVKMVSDKYVSVTQHSCITKTWDTRVIVKMVRDKYVSVIQNSCVTKDMGYTFDCKDGE